jgi:hypothetical protein
MSELLELHWNHGNAPVTPANPGGSWAKVFSETKEAHIHVSGISYGGPECLATEWGFLYWWINSTKFTHMLSVGKGQPMNNYINYGDTPIVVPPGVEYCLQWTFIGMSQDRQIFGDLTYSLHDVA